MSSIFPAGSSAHAVCATVAVQAPQQERYLGSIEQIFHVPHPALPPTSFLLDLDQLRGG